MGFETHTTEYGTREARDDEEAMARANERIGSVLSQVWQSLRGDLAPQDSARIQGNLHLAFRPTSDTTRVWVDAVDHNAAVRNEDTHLKSFRIRLVPPEALPKWEWIVNESIRGSGVAYTPAFLEHDRRQENACERGAHTRTDLREVRDPTIAEVQRAARVLEECWRLFSSGDKDAIYYWA
jgi:hypothetical protein